MEHIHVGGGGGVSVEEILEVLNLAPKTLLLSRNWIIQKLPVLDPVNFK